MTMKTIVRKKANINVKEELLNSLRENDEDEEETEMKTANNPTETIELINHYEEIIRTQYKRVIQYSYKQREILKMFKGTENFFDNARRSRSTVYFKNAVYKIFKKTLV